MCAVPFNALTTKVLLVVRGLGSWYRKVIYRSSEMVFDPTLPNIDENFFTKQNHRYTPYYQLLFTSRFTLIIKYYLRVGITLMINYYLRAGIPLISIITYE